MGDPLEEGKDPGSQVTQGPRAIPKHPSQAKKIKRAQGVWNGTGQKVRGHCALAGNGKGSGVSGGLWGTLMKAFWAKINGD